MKTKLVQFNLQCCFSISRKELTQLSPRLALGQSLLSGVSFPLAFFGRIPCQLGHHCIGVIIIARKLNTSVWLSCPPFVGTVRVSKTSGQNRNIPIEGATCAILLSWALVWTVPMALSFTLDVGSPLHRTFFNRTLRLVFKFVVDIGVACITRAAELRHVKADKSTFKEIG